MMCGANLFVQPANESPLIASDRAVNLDKNSQE